MTDEEVKLQRQTRKAIDNWLTNLFVFGMLMSGVGLTTWALGGDYKLVVGIMLIVLTFTIRPHPEFED